MDPITATEIRKGENYVKIYSFVMLTKLKANGSVDFLVGGTTEVKILRPIPHWWGTTKVTAVTPVSMVRVMTHCLFPYSLEWPSCDKM